MCGIIGIYSPRTDQGLELLVAGLHYLRRRGPEGSGAAFINPENGNISCTTTNTARKLDRLDEDLKRMAFGTRAKFFLGQQRYITDDRVADKNLTRANTQPIYLYYDGDHGLNQEIILVHNGQIRRKDHLRKKIQAPANSIADVDTRFLAEYQMQNLRLFGDPWEATKRTIEELLEIDGAASVGFSDGHNLIAWRDAKGYRPLWAGRIRDSIVFVSETGLFREASAIYGSSEVEIFPMIKPGEMVLIDKKGKLERRVLVETETRPCSFEVVYLMDEMSRGMTDGTSVRRTREEIGREMGLIYFEELRKYNVIVPAMNSGLSYAQGLARSIPVPYRSLLRKPQLKDPLARNFLSAKSGAGFEFTVDEDVKGLDVIITDDSLMRGTTAVKMYAALKDAGAKNVAFVLGWPAALFDCHYGVDFKSKELLAYQLIKRGVIHYREGEAVNYNIQEVNTAVTGLLRDLVDERYPGKYLDRDDLKIYFPTSELIENKLALGKSCLQCVRGI
ncbi:hypothetical protein HYX12_02100 [Candidatus Woesearchaeota archaeon]|nr:hypothetical protein [Candidatus Woesearchaeota archaeon]